jgi:para-nitrobenzyl esterase
MKNKYFNYSFILLVATLLTACGGGGGGGGGSGNDETLTGVFIDSPVEGLRWKSGDMAGTTDTAGTFQYKSGARVQFYVGDILVGGGATGDSVLIPLDLVPGAQDFTDPTVTNIIRFLMTLDNDDDPSNGIEITKGVSNLALGESVDFAQSTTDFTDSGDVQVLVATLTSARDAGARSLVSVSAARAHIENSIKDLLVGRYSGTFSGDNSGTWEGAINTSGLLVGTATSSATGTVSFSGSVNFDGSGSTDFATSGGVSDGTVFSGTFNPTGSGSGTWSGFGADTGTWSGTKTKINSGGVSDGNPGDDTGEPSDNVYGSLSITGGGQGVPSIYVPVRGTGSSAGAAEGFLQTVWIGGPPAQLSLSTSIADNYQGISGAGITFGGSPTYTCESGFVGLYGDCGGAALDHTSRTVTFSNVKLQAAGNGAVITLNGTLKY